MANDKLFIPLNGKFEITPSCTKDQFEENFKDLFFFNGDQAVGSSVESFFDPEIPEEDNRKEEFKKCWERMNGYLQIHKDREYEIPTVDSSYDIMEILKNHFFKQET